MRADPMPNHCVGLIGPNGAPAQTDAHGKHRQRRVDLFELKAGVVGVLPPDAIRFQRALLDFLRKCRI